MDFEQRVLGWCSEEDEPRFEWGTTSIVFPGQHVRMSNIDADGRWIESERFVVDGKEVVRRAGDQLPDALARSFRDIRTVISRVTFSPESGGKLNPSTAMLRSRVFFREIAS